MNPNPNRLPKILLIALCSVFVGWWNPAPSNVVIDQLAIKAESLQPAVRAHLQMQYTGVSEKNKFVKR